MISTVIGSSVLTAGAVLGWAAPRWGLALLVGYVSVTSSLSWQLGGANLATPFLFAIGYLAAFGLRHRPAAGGTDDTFDSGTIRWAAYLFAGTVAVATTLALIRNGVARQTDASFASLIMLFNPPGLPGIVQTALISVLGPALMLATLRLLRAPHNLAAFPGWYLIGTALAVATPLIQRFGLDPTVRPDLGSTFSIGLPAFFQDPHSYAAYLTLGCCVATGLSVAALARRDGGRALGAGVIALGAVAALLYTGSRTGLLATGVGLAAAALVCAVRFGAGAERRWPLPVFFGALIAALAIGAAVFLIDPAQRFAYALLSEIGSPLLWQPLSERGDVGGLLTARRELWGFAAEAVRARPLWGLGAEGVTAALRAEGSGFENVHNHYLQVAAEYGIPGLLCFVALLGAVSARLLGGARRAAPAEAVVLAAIWGALVGTAAAMLLSHPLLLTELQIALWALLGWGLALVSRRP